MGLLKVISDAPGYVKATFQGPQGSGKTRTAVELAVATAAYFKSAKPVAFFDTETGSDYIASLIEERTGQPPIRVKTRSFDQLGDVVKECVDGAADVLIVDSITHIWRELQDSYMASINANRQSPKTRMDIQDIMRIKKLWEPWPDDFMNAPIHIIVCGREGNEWGNEENEETGKRDLVQVGKKMKVEAEFGYEASLMVSMAIEQRGGVRVKAKGAKKAEMAPRRLINVATVLKDRFDVLNGQTCEMPTGEFFIPFIQRLQPARHVKTDLSLKTAEKLNEGGDEWAREKRDRTILCEEIEGELCRVYPGRAARDMAAKAALLDRAFQSRSWTKISQSTDSAKLRAGLDKIRTLLIDKAKFEADTFGAAPAD